MANALLSLKSEDAYELSSELFEALAHSEDRAQLFLQQASEHAFTLSDDINDLVKQHPSLPLCFDLVNVALEKLCQRNLEEDQFYSELCRFVWDGGIFSDDEDRSLAIFCMLVNSRIPYRKLSFPWMPDETFDEYRQKLAMSMRFLEQVAHRSFPQKTQEARAVLEILGECESEDERSVALAMFLEMVRDLER